MCRNANGCRSCTRFGLLNKLSFRPTEEIRTLRGYTTTTGKSGGGSCDLYPAHMQKALTEMNIQLANVISDISGTTGLAILCDIVRGELQDPYKLAMHKAQSDSRQPPRDCSQPGRNVAAKSCYSLSNKVWIYTPRSISKRFKHAMNELTGGQLRSMEPRIDPRSESAPGTAPRQKDAREHPSFALTFADSYTASRVWTLRPNRWH